MSYGSLFVCSVCSYSNEGGIISGPHKFMLLNTAQCGVQCTPQ